MSYSGGIRFIGPAWSTRATFDLDYVINTKWRVKTLYEYDFEQDTAANTRVELIRRLHRWFMTIGLQRDAIRNIPSITGALPPMGPPESKMGP